MSYPGQQYQTYSAAAYQPTPAPAAAPQYPNQPPPAYQPPSYTANAPPPVYSFAQQQQAPEGFVAPPGGLPAAGGSTTQQQSQQQYSQPQPTNQQQQYYSQQPQAQPSYPPQSYQQQSYQQQQSYPPQQPFPQQPSYPQQQQQQRPPQQGGAPAGSHIPAASYGREDVLMQQFRAIAARYEISNDYARKLKQLEGWEIVLILDDSGSMNTPLSGPAQSADPFAKSITRWDELKHTVSILVDIGAVLDKDGLDIYFLNRPTLLHVTNSGQLNQVFAQPPAGLTPIAPVLRHVLQTKRQVMQEKKLLIIIATDGAPTNERGDSDIATLRNILQFERNADRAFVTFLACTDDDSTMAYLNRWDEELKNLDVVDDYLSEKKEVLAAQGQHYVFTFGNYLIKALLGSVDPEFDQLDEKKPQACCSIQ